LKTAYVEQRRKSDGKYRQIPRTLDSLVRKVARALLSAHESPYTYMDHAWGMFKQGTAPLAHQILGPKILEAFLHQKAARLGDMQTVIHLQTDALQTLLKHGRRYEEILIDPDVQMSALFRYLVAKHLGLDQLAAQFAEEAEDMLKWQPAYRKLLKAALPEEMTIGNPE